MRVIAEGVEEPGERDRLRGMGCDLAQGFLFARPLVAEALRDRLAAEPAAEHAPPANGSDGTLEPVLVSALSDLRERHRALLSVTPDAVIMVFDADRRWRVIEGQLLERLGWQPDELLGRRPCDVLPGDRAAALEDHLSAALDGNRAQLEWVSVRGERPFFLEVSPLRASGGTISGALVVGRAGSDVRLASPRAR
jgi:PAS domain S-box-containing protein